MTQPPNATTPPGIGSQIGPYRIDRLLSQGAMGMVFAGTDTRLHRPVAIKVVVASLAQSSAFLARFDREAAIMARLESPHVIAVYDHGTHEGWPYLVSQYAAGGDLARLIRQYGGMPAPLAANICAQVADALAAAHAVGVVHRDVKPENVLLRDDRMDRPHVYLGDFGVAHTDSSGMTQPGSVAGTWNYLAPERAEGDPGSPAGDIYALGCLFYEAVTGRAPYSGSDVEVALAHLGGEVPQLPGDDDFTRRANVILARVLAKDPAQRPASAVEVRDQLQLLSGSGETYAAGPSVRTRGRATGRTVAAGAAGAVLLAALAGGGVWLATRDSSSAASSHGAAAAPTKKAVVGDLDGDGKGDVMLGLGFDAVSNVFSDDTPDTLFTSTGSAFAAGTTPTAVPQAPLAGDVDGDGKLDAVSISGQHSPFQVTTDAAGVAGSIIKTAYWDIPISAFVADMNGDGRDDIGLVTVGDGKSHSYGDDDPGDLSMRVSVLESEKDGSWSAVRMYDAPWHGKELSLTVDAGDVDGDGNADLVFGHDEEAPGEGVLLSDGSKLSPKDMTMPEQDGPSIDHSLLADLDGDGTAELVVWDTQKIGVFSYDDSGSWEADDWTLSGLDTSDVDRSISSPSVTDVDGDGDSDLVFTDTDYSGTEGKLRDHLVVVLADPKAKRLSVEEWQAPGITKVTPLSKAIGRSVSHS